MPVLPSVREPPICPQVDVVPVVGCGLCKLLGELGRDALSARPPLILVKRVQLDRDPCGGSDSEPFGERNHVEVVTRCVPAEYEPRLDAQLFSPGRERERAPRGAPSVDCRSRGLCYRLAIALSAVKPLRLPFTHGTGRAGCSFVQSAGAGLEATIVLARKNFAALV